MTLGEATKLLADAGVPEPRYDARQIFIKYGGTPSSLIDPRADFDSPKLREAIERRAKREPLQYIFGEVYFYKEYYKLTPDVLIPRQDTEILVEAVIKRLKDGARLLDLCTGSGCIAISAVKNTNGTTAVATDISDAALALASRNAEINGVSERTAFQKYDTLTETVSGSFDAIVSNPPYVTEEAYSSLEDEIYFEPKTAFVAEDGGMIFYKRILESYKNSLCKDGFFAFEIGYDQKEKIKALAEVHGRSCEIIYDYSQNPRVAVIR